MIKIHSPNDEIELSMIRGLLDSEGKSIGVTFTDHRKYAYSFKICVL